MRFKIDGNGNIWSLYEWRKPHMGFFAREEWCFVKSGPTKQHMEAVMQEMAQKKTPEPSYYDKYGNPDECVF